MMPRLNRTPPATPVSSSNIIQAKSDSDIPQTLSNTPYDNVNSSSRYKRPRQDFSPGSELQDLKQEILEMLNKWKAEQQEHFSKFSHEQSSSLAKLVKEVNELESQNMAIQKSYLEIEKNVTFINKQYDDLIKQIDALDKEKQVYRHCIQNLEAKIEDLQQLSRSSCVEFRNVPLTDTESVEDLAAIVTKVSTTVGVPLNKNNVRDVYRLPGKPGTARPIVADFTTVQAKSMLLESVRTFNKKQPKEARLNTQKVGLPGDWRPIYVGEYLPSSSRKLFFAAREFAKLNDFKFCWTANGSILLRKEEGAKRILVKSEQTLRDLARVDQRAPRDLAQVNQ
ncbi:hypothetical protein PYW07_007038 [Mythimna separata]|uniref:FP protein C-terminal domain-containing protein n=1 Tax=Mythimna separata TaxID=271217 RepID=A0AAD8E0T4_MYTSE|nr:hypothetical protein PYW07_007038 [Mythimna separata]